MSACGHGDGVGVNPKNWKVYHSEGQTRRVTPKLPRFQTLDSIAKPIALETGDICEEIIEIAVM